MTPFMTILRLTFLELFRKKVLYFTAVMSVIFVGIYGTGLYYVYKEIKGLETLMQLLIGTQMLTMGLYTAALVVAFLAIFISAGSISGSMEQNSYDVILTAPIKRHTVILGRFSAVLCLMLPYATLLFSAVLLLNRIIGSGIGVQMSGWAVLKAMGIMWLIPIVLSTLGLYFSTFLASAPAGILMTMLFFCGVVGGFLEKIGMNIPAEAGKVLVRMGIVSGLIVPTDPLYRIAFARLMTTDSGLNLSASSMLGASSEPSSAMLVYAILYVLLFLVLSIRRFEAKDL